MKKFMVLYYSSPESLAKMATATPEQTAEAMKPWFAWNEKCGDKMVDLGAPLNVGQKLNKDGKSTSSTKEVSGYSIIQADNMDSAQALLENHPHTAWDESSSIEIYEFIAM